MKNQNINAIIEEWQIALESEKDFLKYNGGTKHILVNGTPLYELGKNTVCLFTLYSELFVSEGTPVRVKIGTVDYQGEVLSLKGLQIEIKINETFKTKIPYAELYSEPWELLDQLCERLEEIKDYRKKLERVKRLLNGDAPCKHVSKMKKRSKNELLYRSFYNATTYLWGPPGTGKSYNLTKLIISHYKNNKSVLVLAHSNAAVDVLMKNIVKELEEKNEWVPGDILRYGYTKDEVLLQHDSILASKYVEQSDSSMDELDNLVDRKDSMLSRAKRGTASKGDLNELRKLQSQLSKMRQQSRENEKDLVDEAKVIGTTLSKSASDSLLYNRQFDLIIVDEISMAYVPQLAFAASLGKRIVVCGDFKQLPPVAVSYRNPLVKKWLQEDLFHHVGIADLIKRGEVHPNLYILQEQRRMHPSISSFTNKYIYQNLVFDHQSVTKNQMIANHKPFAGEASVLVNTNLFQSCALKDESTKSRYNLTSAILSIQMVLSAIVNGVQSIGIVTPYRAQAKLLSDLHKEIVGRTKYKELPIQIATVHRFQGAECDVLFFDTVDTYPQYSVGRLLTDEKSERLINVAITRSKGKFVNLSDLSFFNRKLNNKTTLSKLINHQMEQSHVAEQKDFQHIFKKNISKRLQWFINDERNEPSELIDDIKAATKRVIICMPNLSEMTSALRKIVNELTVKITFVSCSLFDNQKNFKFIQLEQVQPMIIIDDEYLWIGAPFSKHSRNQSMYLCRLQGQKTIQTLKGYMGL
ncbi:AAA family ATPase [Bacillus sp. RG28]|uniref:AAA family ATPase n=1 Tax=Gottfriedia endophytica TaxID=2820819 RepID=A0A940SKC5_9BACI|nr:AAA domain-containing protein [Gottfriedia endophytica]MBP0725869.1 AAA family ATPase [Gottfriedia endophytica]